jgi:hypothetical protein
MFVVEFLNAPNSDLEKLHQSLNFDPYNFAEASLHNDPLDTLHFMSIMHNFDTPEAQRGAVTMALAIGSRHAFVLEPMAKVASLALSNILQRH